MPEETLDSIKTELIYKEFLNQHRDELTFPKITAHQHSRYTPFDAEYKQFIRLIVTYIEPRKEK